MTRTEVRAHRAGDRQWRDATRNIVDDPQYMANKVDIAQLGKYAALVDYIVCESLRAELLQAESDSHWCIPDTTD